MSELHSLQLQLLYKLYVCTKYWILSHCVCSLGCYSGPGCSPPWDTEDRTDPQCSPAPRLRHPHPHSPHYWTTLWLQRSRWVFPLCPFILCLLQCFYHCLFWFTFQFLDILSHTKWPGRLRIFIDRQTANSSSSKHYAVHVQGSLM